jgi:hypothetical protein
VQMPICLFFRPFYLLFFSISSTLSNLIGCSSFVAPTKVSNIRIRGPSILSLLVILYNNVFIVCLFILFGQ